MIQIVSDEEVTFDDKKFDRESVRKLFDNFAFNNENFNQRDIKSRKREFLGRFMKHLTPNNLFER